MTVIEQPVTSATARTVGRELFGHVIDGELVPSLDGATMDVVDPATGVGRSPRRPPGSAADVDRAARSARAAFDDGRWRDLPPLEKERRLRRMAALVAERGDVFAEIDVARRRPAALLHGVHRRSSPSTASTTSPAGRRSSRATIPAVPGEFAVLPDPRADRRASA